MIIELEGKLYSIVEFLHVKPGKGGAFVRTKLKNIQTGAVIDKTFKAGEKCEEVKLEEKKMRYLYHTDDLYYFMDMESFEQEPIRKSALGKALSFLKENLEVTITKHKGKIVGVELPIFVELQVKETAPGVKGDTASGGSKPAIVETGFSISVPLFINEGDTIKVDTRTGAYVERV